VFGHKILFCPEEKLVDENVCSKIFSFSCQLTASSAKIKFYALNFKKSQVRLNFRSSIFGTSSSSKSSGKKGTKSRSKSNFSKGFNSKSNPNPNPPHKIFLLQNFSRLNISLNFPRVKVS
jgi:hypothetical protein